MGVRTRNIKIFSSLISIYTIFISGSIGFTWSNGKNYYSYAYLKQFWYIFNTLKVCDNIIIRLQREREREQETNLKKTQICFKKHLLYKYFKPKYIDLRSYSDKVKYFFWTLALIMSLKMNKETPFCQLKNLKGISVYWDTNVPSRDSSVPDSQWTPSIFDAENVYFKRFPSPI